MRKDDIKAIREILERLKKDAIHRQGFICQWCGHKELAPKGGTCPNSPNHKHQFIKASVENKKCPVTNKSRSILYRLVNY